MLGLIELFLQINNLLMRKLSMDDLHRKTVDEFKVAQKFPVVAVLENIRSAYNVGSVFRTADAFLIESVIITGYTAQPPHKEIKKTALGAEDSVDWKYFATATEAIGLLRNQGYTIYAVEQVEESLLLENLPKETNEKLAFIFGNEVSGVDEATIPLCDGCIEIPQFGMKHSLNISVAAGIVLWQAIQTFSLFEERKL
jgi:tRNA G18 (ribose-2'-O)-methylase SpoU